MAKTARMRGKYQTEYIGGQKRCVFCGEYKKEEIEFPKNGVDADGNTVYRKDCKTCYNIRRKENKHKAKHSQFTAHQRQRGEISEDINFTHQDWKDAVIFFGGECAYCGCTPRRGKVLTKDHIFPVGKGGKTHYANIVPACSRCNSSKQDEDIKEWYMKQEFFSQERLNRIFKWRTIMNQLERS